MQHIIKWLNGQFHKEFEGDLTQRKLDEALIMQLLSMLSNENSIFNSDILRTELIP